MTTAPHTTLTRDCPATTVPYGESVTLDAGGEVHVVQQLGGSITVRTELGLLLRVAGTDADALGLEPPTAPEPLADGNFDIAQVKAVLFTLLWSGIGSAILFKVVDAVVGLRVTQESEREGLDLAAHGERAYNY